ncbi:hypothetical protein [Sphingomonas sp. NIBR02145]|uniref:hypothetical protein n=1 Tax=Sphingomonas sp. NIBR02145 TaxID=3014784 RepID=UPI0022B5E27E|nr:hypothetical protein [Sphingomonas sp. NIBR02145]WHU03356.1 hypothetical protein O3305_01745 [Sphingomonas sp. NIBR02145]
MRTAIVHGTLSCMDGTRAFRKSAGTFANCEKAPDYAELTPLRIPAGWSIGWNQLHRDKRVEDGDFGGSSVFYATNPGRRFVIDVEFRPEHNPDGHFELTVQYQPWPRDARGRRQNDAPFAFDANAKLMHSIETRSYAELIEQLETWLARCTIWSVEGN